MDRLIGMTMKELTQPEPSRGPQGKMADTDFTRGPQGKMSAYSHVPMESDAPLPDMPAPPPPPLRDLPESPLPPLPLPPMEHPVEPLPPMPPKAPEPPAAAPDDIEENVNRAINRLKTDIDALEKRLSDDIALVSSENQESSTPFTPIEQYVERPTSPDIPFEIMVSYTGESPLVYVRNGGFYDGETFAGTDGSTSFETFDYTTLDASFGVGDEVWATLTITLSTGAWAASLDTTEQTASTGERVISVLIGTISSEGGVRQNITGHIPVIGGEEDQLDHSFRPVQESDTTFSITAGRVYVGVQGSLAIASFPAGDTSFSTNTHFQIRIDWSSNINVPVVTWMAGTSFGNNATNALIRYYPILEFGTAGDFTTLVKRQTNDIHAPTYPVPEIADKTKSNVLVWNDDSSIFQWVPAGAAYSVLQTKSDGTIGFDYVRVMT